jgi:hypothetical protein
MAVPSGKEKMVAGTYNYISAAAWRIDNPYTGFSTCAVYICYFLTAFYPSKVAVMTDKIVIEKEKKRIPVPKKPPKVEKNKKAYNRKKEKDKLRKNKNGDKQN